MRQYGKIIAQLRREHNMTQAELGAKLNVTYQAVSKWENDQSQPDFATMAQIAELFHVPLTIFLGGEEKETAVAAAVAESAEPVLGYCTVCGNAVRQDNVAQQRPVLICKDCVEADARRKEEEARAAEEQKERQEQGRKLANKRTRNRGLIWGGVIALVVMILVAVFYAIGGGTAGAGIVAVLITGIFIYTFVAQMFWGGFVFETCLFGGKIIGTPGIIFSFDLDGFIFLIVMKVIFALLKLFIFLITFVFFAIVSILLSPFTFVPALIRVSRHGWGGDD